MDLKKKIMYTLSTGLLACTFSFAPLSAPAVAEASGWDVESLASFDEDKFKTMSAEERAAYIEAKRARKAAHGLSSSSYKAEKEAARIKEEAAEKAAEVIEQAEAEAKLVKEEANREANRIIRESLTNLTAYNAAQKAKIDKEVKIRGCDERTG